MRVVIVGNRMLARHVLRYCLETNWDVVGSVAASGAAARRQAGHASFADLAESEGFDLVETPDINQPWVVDRLNKLQPDLCICPGWHQIIEERVLEVPSEGFIGYHASRLPKGRGGAPVNWAMIHAESACGLSLFFYEPGVDAGDIIAQTSVPIERRDDVSTVLERLAHAAIVLIDRVADRLAAGNVDRTPQSVAEATYRPRRQPQDGLIDWTVGPLAQHDWIRAQTHPYPGAYSFLDGERVRIWSATPSDVDADDREPGEVIGIDDGEGVNVATGNGVIRLDQIQVGDDPLVWADDSPCRYDIKAGRRLGSRHAPEGWLYTGIRDGDGGTRYETNLSTGQEGKLKAVAIGWDESLEVRVTLDNEEILTEGLRFDDGSAETSVRYSPETSGTKGLRVDFYRDGERIDSRYLKLFVSD